jgi:hypothetical protein
VILAAVMASPAWPQTDRSLISDPNLMLEDPVNRALSQQHYHDMWLLLSQSKITWIRTAAALHFLGNFIRESDPELRAEGERLLTAIIAAEPRDTHALWLLLDACHEIPDIPGCASTHIGDRLIESAPDNAAVYLKAAGVAVGTFAPFDVQDNKANRHALLDASRAPRIETYYGGDALELYQELKAFEEEYRPAHEPAIGQPAHLRAFSMAWTVSSMLRHLSFVGLFDLCEAQVLEDRSEYVEACLTLAGTMQATGKTLITKALGYGLERKVMEAMGADKETTLYLARKARMSTQVSVCQMPTWMKAPESMIELDESPVIAYLSDLGTVGEVGAIRNAAIRGYEANPDDYEQDPVLCDQLMDLDSETMGIFLGVADPKRLMESH